MEQQRLRTLLVDQLKESKAHVHFSSSVSGIAFADTGSCPEGFDHSIWELVEHIRIAQHDIVTFSTDPDYEAPAWPDDYWPERRAPQSPEEWGQSLDAIASDKQRMAELVMDPSNDLFKPFEHGDGQTLFREAILIIDHTSYHIGQIVQLRKAMGIW